VGKLVNLVGPLSIKVIFFPARRFTVADAPEMGFVNSVMANEMLEDYTRKDCAMIGDKAPIAMHARKRIVGGLERGASPDLTASDVLLTAKITSRGADVHGKVSARGPRGLTINRRAEFAGEGEARSGGCNLPRFRHQYVSGTTGQSFG
jgi:hypothetical protein